MKILSKKLFFRLHSWIGVQLSILFFIVCLAGTLATLSSEYDWLFFPEVSAVDTGQKASYNDMVSNIKKVHPNGRIASFFNPDETYLCNIVQVFNNKQRYYAIVNPYSGLVQGSTTITFQRLFRDLHYFLYLPFKIGTYTVLFFGFILLISSITALYFYKNWWKKLFDSKVGKGKLVLYRSLHRFVSVWSVPFAILFSIAGIWYFSERTDVGNIQENSNTSSPVAMLANKNKKFEKLDCFTLDYDKAVKISEQAIPNLKVKTITPPRETKKFGYLMGKIDVPLARNGANQVFLHPLDYSVLKTQEAIKISKIAWLNDVADPLHFGNWGGLITKISWFIDGMAISSLILTGIWMYTKRTSKRKKKKAKIWLYLNWSIVAGINFYMFKSLGNRYLASDKFLLILSLFILISIFLTWYLFIKKIKTIQN